MREHDIRHDRSRGVRRPGFASSDGLDGTVGARMGQRWFNRMPAILVQLLSSDIEVLIVTLLGERDRSASICPSEVARRLDSERWRSRMEEVRKSARALARRGRIEIAQRGRAIDPDAAIRGPIRLRLPRA